MPKDTPSDTTWIGTRDAGDALLTAFVPHMGKAYAQKRNFDLGPDQHKHVSRLSPYTRRRLVLEVDLIRAAIGAHGYEASEKFIQEVIWRGYFKGWLERRPQVWQAYRDGLTRDLERLETDRGLSRAVARAEAGRTGLACFDAWAHELVGTGYLHNHARMWFASIWIFTLELPWRLGADFFLRHLLDGDPASNTLGWRWVAGLHTRGKSYHAQAWNIAKFTQNRFTPKPQELAAIAEALTDQEPDGLPDVQPLRHYVDPDPHAPTAVLITAEDGRIEDFALERFNIVAAATLSASHLRSPRDVSPRVHHFEDTALADTAQRSGLSPTVMRAGAPGDLVRWADRAGARQIATPYIPQGPLHDWIADAMPRFGTAGLQVCEWQRPWDQSLWPHATAGFFKVKSKIPALLNAHALL